MLDTVHSFLPRERAGNIDLLALIPYYLDKVTEHTSETGQVSISGSLTDYLRVNVYEGGVSIKGSLPKYYLNDNIQTLTRSDTQRAIDMISDTIQLPVHKAKVKRIDIAQNIPVNYAPELYYHYFGESRNYSRLLQPQSLYYNNHQKVKLFYNKIAECKKKKVLIPAIMSGVNIFRYELRFSNRIPKQFNKTEVILQDLYTEAFYMELIDRWKAEYYAIDKIHSLNFNYSEMKTPNDFLKQYLASKIIENGQDKLLKEVEELRARKVFADKPEYYSRLKKEIKKLCKTPELTTKSELITELDKKINDAVRYYR